MGFVIFIFVLVFAGLLAILYFGLEEAERTRTAAVAAPAVVAAPPGRSADEVVRLIEHRIEIDLREVAAVLRRTAGVARPV